MKDTDFIQIKELLSTPQSILLTTHTNPDGDAIGSMLALFWYLKKKGHQVQMLVPDPFPSFLAWMTGQELILVYSSEPEKCQQAIAGSTLIFSLDYNDLDRLENAKEFVLKSDAKKILLDHHLYPANQFDFRISVIHTSSTAELVFTFIREAGDSHLMDTAIAECIYAGIITDTGSFSYSCNHEETYLVVAELFRHGIDGEHLHRLIYDTYSEYLSLIHI